MSRSYIDSMLSYNVHVISLYNLRALNEHLNWNLMIFNEQEQTFKSIFSLEQFRFFFFFFFYHSNHERHAFIRFDSIHPAISTAFKSTVCRYLQTPTTI